ncbi:MAG TPA: amino acid permease [Dongiaceae bacterium]|nr:amino acid permease [Dongiaceae bacterium]
MAVESAHPTGKADATGRAATRPAMGLWSCIALVVGNMIGAGIFMLPSVLAGYGTLSLWGWAVSVAAALSLAVVFARLSAIIPSAGGPHVYTREAYGDFAGFLCAWCYWKAAWIGNAAIAVTVVGYFTVFFPKLANPVAGASVAIGLPWVLAFINLGGLGIFSLVQNACTILKLIPLLLIAVCGWFFFHADNFATPIYGRSIPETSWLGAVSTLSALTMWSFLGLESATVPAGDVKNPRKTIPRATLIGTLIGGLVYVTAVTAVLGMLPAKKLTGSTAPFADAARLIVGDWGYYLIAAGAIIAAVGALNGWVMMQGQIPMAAARDGLLPEGLGKLNKHGVPGIALVVSSALVSVLILMNFRHGLVDAFQVIVLIGTMTALVPYMLCAAGLLQLMVDRRAVFPASLIFLVLVASLAFTFSIWALYGSGPEAVFWGFLVLAAGIPIYTWRKWRSGAGAARSQP